MGVVINYLWYEKYIGDALEEGIMENSIKSWRIERWNDHGRPVISIRDNEKTLAVISTQLDGSEEEIAQTILQAVKAG